LFLPFFAFILKELECLPLLYCRRLVIIAVFQVWHLASSLRKKSAYMKEDKKIRWSPEAPGWKHFGIVLIAVGILVGLSWIAWFKFGWFH
jgi:cytochrome c biogenesis factor